MSDADPLAGCLIRPALKRESPEVASVIEAAFAQYQSEVPPRIFEAYLADLRHLDDHWAESEMLVAERGGRIVGTVAFYGDASTEGLGLPKEWAGFRRLAVHPAVRGHGIGQALTRACIDAARKRGAPALGIHTSSFMQAACRIYEDVGFLRCPEYDLRAVDILGLDEDAGEVAVIAYKLEMGR
jgi:predicted N-acetyltransferase YhbS